MRGTDERSGELFSYVDLEARVRRDHPLRAIRLIANEALGALTKDFAALYAREGRPSIAPEKLLRAMLLQAFYTVRSERQLMDRLEFDLLFRWFVGLGVDDPVWDHSTFSKNRDRLLAGDVAAKFLAAVLNQPRVKRLLSNEHFSVDGTLVAAWASAKSFKPKDGSGDDDVGPGRNAERNFRANAIGPLRPGNDRRTGTRLALIAKLSLPYLCSVLEGGYIGSFQFPVRGFCEILELFTAPSIVMGNSRQVPPEAIVK